MNRRRAESASSSEKAGSNVPQDSTARPTAAGDPVGGADSQVQRLQNALRQSNALAEHINARSRSLVAACEAAIAERDAAIGERDAARANAESLVADRDAVRAHAETEIANLSTHLTETRHKLDQSDSERNEFARALHRSELLRSFAATQLVELDLSVQRFKVETEELRANCSSAERDIERQGLEIAGLSDQLAETRLRLSDAESANAKAAREIGRRDGEIADLEQRMIVSNELLAESRREHSVTHARLLALQAKAQADLAERDRDIAELRRDLRRQAGSLASVTERIRAFVDSRPSPWERLGASLGIHRRSDEYQQLAGWLALPDELSSAPLPVHHADFLQDQMAQLTERKNPFLRANSLAELLSWDDLDFVRCAYVTVLGRQPDLPGQAHYVRQVRAGYSKLDVLWRLRRSAEGREHDPGIAGFDRALKRAARERRPLMGALLRLMRADADSSSRRDRALRALMNATSLNQRYLHSIAERITAEGGVGDAAPAMFAASAPPAASPDLARQQASVASPATGFAPEQTPELDHLRGKATAGRLRGDVAP
jgi:hypothetical protein